MSSNESLIDPFESDDDMDYTDYTSKINAANIASSNNNTNTETNEYNEQIQKALQESLNDNDDIEIAKAIQASLESNSNNNNNDDNDDIEKAIKASLEEFNNSKSNVVKDWEDNFGTEDDNKNINENIDSFIGELNSSQTLNEPKKEAKTMQDLFTERRKRRRPKLLVLATFPLSIYYDYDKYKHLEGTNKCIASNQILNELFDSNDDSKIDYLSININLNIFKNNMLCGSVEPCEFVVDDNVYVSESIFNGLNIEPGTKLYYRF